MKKKLLLMLGIIPSIASGQTIGAYISSTEFREFMPYNLGVTDTTLDPLNPSKGIHGAKYQWGKKVPSINQLDDQTNSGVVLGWDTTTPVPDNSWMDGTKTANDPCPSGFRVPTQNEWLGVINNNSQTYVGSWVDNATNYDSGIKFGNTLFLPAAGYRYNTDGTLYNRGIIGSYWSSTQSPATGSRIIYFGSDSATVGISNRTFGFSVRCISESSTLSTQDIKKNKGLGISLYPNPANSEFSITHAGASKKDLGKVKVGVYDLAGKLFLQQEGKENISVSHIPNGLYLVKIVTSDGKTQTEKLIIGK